ncbi:MAG: hypothetical protein ACJAVK_001289 [Akkermansiaceae bacterium]|jgi:hypothetical protein
MSEANVPIIYCRCAYANALPEKVKNGVLEKLCGSSVPVTAVSDLCEMSARNDPRLKEITELAGKGPIKIAACYPRAVRWLFHAADTPLPEGQVEYVNLRELTTEDAVEALIPS